jgi:beta-glucosidase-like glycosyl hydrolase/CubicO group peptidase (beta-lactamase class C family)
MTFSQKLYIPILILVFLLIKTGYSQTLSLEEQWVDSVYNSLSLDEKIAQLMVVRANQSGEVYDEKVTGFIKKYNIGGVTFFKGNATDQLNKTNQWQSISKTPLLITIDGEWGLGMRLSNTISYPYQMTLGAIENDSLIYEMGTQIAEQCKRMGIHSNFAPVVDVNNNAANPVIGMRSFGDVPAAVANKASIYAKALKDNGIIATAKHFPGHGDTQTDSHNALPTITGDRKHLNENELLPFNYIIQQDIDGIMVAHLNIPALDDSSRLPSTLSKKIITGLLKEDLGFYGLIFTDALDMKGVTNSIPSGQIELKALIAGNDVLLLPADVPKAIQTIKSAVDSGQISTLRIEESCRKILTYKYRAGLNTWKPINNENLLLDLQKTEYQSLVADLYNNALTLIRTDSTLPLLTGTKLKIATLAIGNSKISEFQRDITVNGLIVKHFYLPKKADAAKIALLKKELAKFDLVIVSVQNTNILAAKNFGIEDQAIRFMNELTKTKSVFFNLFASPYALNLFKVNSNYKSILIAYQDNQLTEKAAAEIIIGNATAKGHLPVGINESFPTGSGIICSVKLTENLQSKKQAIDNLFIKKIDSFAYEGIEKKAYPGCQIVAMKQGEIIFQKSYGFHTYEKTDSVKNTDLYDLASLTKMLASTLAIMKLYEQKKISLDDTLGKFFPYLIGTNKSGLKIIDLMTHQSGLDGWIPFHLRTFNELGPDPELYSNNLDLNHPDRVAENLFIVRTFRNEIFSQIAESKMKSKEYRYSDLGFYYIPAIVELVSNKRFDVFVDENFFSLLGLKSTCFRPLTKFPKARIVPTELDNDFRHQLLQGDVHDYGAALLGGISGHAGLFSNATEVAIIMQLIINEGVYNGIRIFEAETIKKFTSSPFTANKNRRGIGFDKPPLNENEPRMPAPSASPNSFGHSGFTGTFAWADPENQLVFVFLSNRIHPDATNPMLSKLNTRTNIHEMFYKALKSHALTLSN